MPQIIVAGDTTRNYRDFPMVDANGDPITGEAPNIAVQLLIDGVSAAGQGAVTEPDPSDFPGVYRYTFAASEIDEPATGWLRPTLAGAVAATYEWEVTANDWRAEAADASSVAEAVWGAGTRTLTNFGTLAADVASAVWEAGSRSLTSFGSLAADVASAVWGAATRTLTAISDSTGVGTLLERLTAGRGAALDNLDATVSSRASTQDVTDAQGDLILHGDNNWVGGGGGDSVWSTGQRDSVIASSAAAATSAASADTKLSTARLAAIDRIPAEPAAAGDVTTARDALLAAVEGLNNVAAEDVEAALAQVLEAATVMADIRRVNDVAITGTGAAGDLWRARS